MKKRVRWIPTATAPKKTMMGFMTPTLERSPTVVSSVSSRPDTQTAAITEAVMYGWRYLLRRTHSYQRGRKDCLDWMVSSGMQAVMMSRNSKKKCETQRHRNCKKKHIVLFCVSFCVLIFTLMNGTLFILMLRGSEKKIQIGGQTTMAQKMRIILRELPVQLSPPRHSSFR